MDLLFTFCIDLITFPTKMYRVQINQNPFIQMAGSVALSCNPATGRPGEADDLRSGQLLDGHLRWTGVRTKPGVDMVNGEESPVSRSTKDGRIGSGGKLSSQKAARRCSSGIAPVSGYRSAARSTQSHPHLFTQNLRIKQIILRVLSEISFVFNDVSYVAM